MTARLRKEWQFRDGALVVALVGLSCIATREVWQNILMIGLQDEENSYVLLAPIVAAWLFWVRRERLRFCAPQWTISGSVVVILGAALSWFGREQGHDLFWHFGALSVVFGSAVTILGWRFIRSFLPVFVSLIFLLPTPGMIRLQVAGPLQEVSATITHSILETFGVPVILEGNLLKINDYEVAVAEACNGMRMVAALALVTYAFVFSVPMRQSIRLAFLVFSPLIALVVNIIRLAPTVLIYGYGSPEAGDWFHDISGWAMLAVALAILWAMQLLLRWLEIPIVPYSTGKPEYAR
jgi:exosortase